MQVGEASAPTPGKPRESAPRNLGEIIIELLDNQRKTDARLSIIEAELKRQNESAKANGATA